MRMYMQVAKFTQDGRGLVSVTFEFNDHDVAHVAFLSCGNIVEAQVRVDGETLRTGFVYQCDTVETVL